MGSAGSFTAFLAGLLAAFLVFARAFPLAFAYLAGTSAILKITSI